MATYTVHLNLKKPTAVDSALIADINANMDAIDTAIGSPTPSATANELMKRDSSGRAKAVDPAADQDVATKKYVDMAIPAALGTPTSSATANQLIKRDAAGRAQVAAPNVAADIARKDTVMGVGKWNLLQSYTAAGTYTYTVPDLYGDGRSYQIGVYEVGGGGSGAFYPGSSYSAACGGAAGYGKNILLTVTPGQQITVAVGSGGAAISGSTPAAGNAGGSTSFNSTSVNGGAGGGIGGTGANGGQGSDAMAYGSAGGTSKYGCVPATAATPNSSDARLAGTSQSPNDGQNQFDTLMTTLAAGGGIYSGTTQIGATLPNGTKGGNGVYGNSGTVAESATGNGNGGGACMVVSGGSGTSGAGAPGGVWIYARGL